MNSEGISVADALALRNSGNYNGYDNCFGGNGSWWIIILILLFGGGWRNGFGNNDPLLRTSYSARNEQCF